MKKKLAAAAVTLVIAGVLAFLPRTAQSLNPNHECAFCHTLHNAPGTRLTVDVDVEVLCLTCHGAAGTSSLKADVHINDNNTQYPPFRITCMTCHTPHSERDNWLGAHPHDETGGTVLDGGTNIKLVGRKLDTSGFAMIDTPNSGLRDVVFEFRGREIDDVREHSFADDDEDANDVWDGACEVCHTLTKFHRNNSSGGHSHNRGRTCTNCHDHIDNFMRN